MIELGTTLKQIDWVIQGGESGSVKRPFDTAWADQLRDQCQKVGVPYFLKQLGMHVIENGQRTPFKSVDFVQPKALVSGKLSASANLLDAKPQ